MINDHITFSVEKCSNSSKKDCHTDEDIDEFIRDATIDAWAIQNDLDFTSFG